MLFPFVSVHLVSPTSLSSLRKTTKTSDDIRKRIRPNQFLEKAKYRLQQRNLKKSNKKAYRTQNLKPHCPQTLHHKLTNPNR